MENVEAHLIKMRQWVPRGNYTITLAALHRAEMRSESIHDRGPGMLLL
jgi:hypothetical protein